MISRRVKDFNIKEKALNFKFLFILISIFLLIFTTTTFSQDISLENKVKTYTLDNGMKIIMVPQDFGATIHFNLTFNVGGIDEPHGQDGIAHMVEHMAFKGTKSLGTEHPQKEQELLQKLDRAAAAYFSARKKGVSKEKLKQLKEEFEKYQKKAKEAAAVNPLQKIYDTHGAQNYNAGTGYDTTSYYLSLPSNKLELFARIQADVIKNAVFRYFYEEVEVVKEERRQRNEDDPLGYLQEEYLKKAFSYHPYGHPLIGSMEEISNYRRTEAKKFWNKHYHPNNAVLVMIGDLNPEQDIKTIRKYFGSIPRGPEKESLIAFEPIQTREKRTTVTFDAEPQMIIGYHKPTYPDRDAYIMDVISALLGRGRTSRLYQRLVVEEQVAVNVSTYSSMPGQREPNQFFIHIVTKHPHTPREVEKIVYEEINKLKNKLVSIRELEKVHNQVKGQFIRQLDSRSGLSRQLAFYEHFLGGWENLSRYPEKIKSITPEEIKETANYYLNQANRTVAILETEKSKKGDE